MARRTFLEYVAEDMMAKYGHDMSRIAVVMPNRRAALFLNAHLARIAGRPIWSPAYMTIGEMFERGTRLRPGDRTKLVFEAYRSYAKLTGSSETIDHFWSWGELLLSDFDEMDKAMADVGAVLANVKALHALDDVSYLSPEQREAIKEFFRGMSEGHASELQKRFLTLWSHLEDIYRDLRERLTEQGIAYEGMLWREVAERGDIDLDGHETYVFVGFFNLTKVMKRLFSMVHATGKARFYWDFDDYYKEPRADRREQMEAGNDIRECLLRFPNELDETRADIYRNFLAPKSITFVSATTENAQARYAGQWLMENGRYRDGTRTAIVLCDQSLLPTVTRCLPAEAGKINVTVGFPLSETPLASLVASLISMQEFGYVGKRGFRTGYVTKVLGHPYSRHLSDGCATLLAHLRRNKPYCCAAGDACGNDEAIAELLSRHEDNAGISGWIRSLLNRMALRAMDSGAKDDPMLMESLFRMSTLLGRISDVLREEDLEISLHTFQKLVSQAIGSTSIPFNGEPAEGVQVMGALDTRNLDFDHVLLLSCNEGNMPQGGAESSFIPYLIREAHGLASLEWRVQTFSYTFHSLLQRASDITITYNNSTENGKTGEMSRFMLQLLAESGFDIKRMALSLKPEAIYLRPKEIAKTEAIMDILKGMEYLSPTAINRYLRCPLQFYYQNVAGIREEDGDPEEDGIDNRAFGNIFHKAAALVYGGPSDVEREVSRDAVERLLNTPGLVEDAVDKAMRDELYGEDWKGTYPEYDGLEMINREVIIKFLRRLLTYDRDLAPFRMKLMEQRVDRDFTFRYDGRDAITMKVGGIIDRLDEVTDPDTGMGRIRVIDYKTGRSEPKVGSLEQVFSRPVKPSDHTDYCLQSMLYSIIVSDSRELNPGCLAVSPSLLYIQNASGDDYDPTISIGKNKDKVKVRDIRELKADFESGLEGIVREILDRDVPFARPEGNDAACAMCPYHGTLCGTYRMEEPENESGSRSQASPTT